jgi:hypothetical protein
MIRIEHFDFAGEGERRAIGSRVAAKCDGCGELGPWRVCAASATDHDEHLALLAAFAEGWKERVRGRTAEAICPKCAGRPAATGQLGLGLTGGAAT